MVARNYTLADTGFSSSGTAEIVKANSQRGLLDGNDVCDIGAVELDDDIFWDGFEG